MPIDPRVKLTHVMEAVQHRLSHSHTIGEQTKALEEARDEMMAQLRTMPPTPATTPATDLDAAQKELDAAKAKHETAAKVVSEAEAKVAAASAKVDDEKKVDDQAYHKVHGSVENYQELNARGEFEPAPVPPSRFISPLKPTTAQQEAADDAEAEAEAEFEANSEAQAKAEKAAAKAAKTEARK